MSRAASSEEPIIISADQRNALYRLLLGDFSVARDLEAACGRGEQSDMEECYRLGRRVTDCMRLIQDGGLGWGTRPPIRSIWAT